MYEILMDGFPGRTPRGSLGWSTILLLRTPDGPALFDTGGAGDRPGLLAGLADRGIAREDVRTIVLSHLHYDHVANIECFPRAEIVIHQDELAYFYEQQSRDLALPVYQIEGMLARSKLQLINGEIEVLPGFRLIRTPGHTGGHCSLVVEWDGQTHVLAQDAIKHRGEAVSGSAPGAFSEHWAAASIARILAMADIVVPGHDAPLRIAGGTITATRVLRQEIGLTLSDRIFAMEA